jgi:hypothetical protein
MFVPSSVSLNLRRNINPNLDDEALFSGEDMAMGRCKLIWNTPVTVEQPQIAIINTEVLVAVTPSNLIDCSISLWTTAMSTSDVDRKIFNIEQSEFTI